MGLDNGVVYKRNNKEKDVAYWRKCWQLRGAILRSVFWGEYKSDKDIYKFNIDAEHLKKIIKICKLFSGEKNWEDTYWEWDCYKFQHQKNIREMNKLLIKLIFMDIFHIKYDCYFYDSY